MSTYFIYYYKSSAEGGIRTLESRRDTGLANLRHTRLGYLDLASP